MKVLISGATGYLGSNIAGSLIENGHEVIATYRKTSSFEKINYYKSRIKWIDSADDSFKEKIVELCPEVLIHTAWSGITISERNNWELQLSNFIFSKKMIEDSIDVGVKKIIVLGSQAEYGIKGFKVNENTLPEPSDAYGAVKLLLLNYLRIICETQKVEWYWVRVFSVFGKNENSSWLIPSVISHLKNNERMQLTNGEQEYNYLYIDDFLDRFNRIVEEKQNFSGIYNICNENTIQLKELLTLLSNILGVSTSLLDFGAIPYRKGQNMLISGSCLKFRKKFNYNKPDNNLAIGLKRTVASMKIK